MNTGLGRTDPRQRRRNWHANGTQVNPEATDDEERNGDMQPRSSFRQARRSPTGQPREATPVESPDIHLVRAQRSIRAALDLVTGEEAAELLDLDATASSPVLDDPTYGILTHTAVDNILAAQRSGM